MKKYYKKSRRTGMSYKKYVTGRKSNWICHTLRRNCLLKHVIERNIEGGIEVTGRRGRRRKKLKDGFKEKREYWKLKEKELDGIVRRIRFGRGHGPVVRQAKGSMNKTYFMFIGPCIIVIVEE